MSASDAASALGPRLARLLGFLERDPNNASLLADASATAFEAGQLDVATQLIARQGALGPLSPAIRNLKGLVAIAAGSYAEAASVFDGLLTENPGEPGLSFNLAWSRAMLEDFEGALAVLDEQTASTVDGAAALKIQMMHHLGRLEDALACGMGLAEARPHDQALMGALANVAMDAEDLELTRHYAERAGDQHEGLAAMGMVMLGEEELDQALGYFDRALAARGDDARALVGRGLALMGAGDQAGAAKALDQGAKIFGDHLGSWVAAAWAYFVQGDLATSRQRFETALAVDDTFAEIHGGLAVLDLAEGDLENARRRTDIALRLDRRCFGAALAKTMLLTAEGDAASAERVRNIALNTPMGQSGKTIAQVMAAVAGKRGSVG